jgi:phenylacetic acid degradation operon negative regulatory protein
MASLLLGRDPPHARTRDLIAWCDLFGIPPGTARVALHRMVARGEAEARDGGYALAGRLARRREEQAESLHPRTVPWQGAWLVAIAPRTARTAGVRAEWRDAMRAAHLAELRPGVWTRPDNLGGTRPGGASWWTGTPEEDPAALARRLFATERWQADARRRIDALAAATGALGDGLVREAFVTGAAALRHVRADPLLPPPLLPADWPGAELRAAYGRFQTEFTRAARTWFRAR